MPREGRFFELFNAHAAQIVEGSRALALLMANPESPTAHAERKDAAEHIVWAWIFTIPCSALIAAFAWWLGGRFL